MLPRSAARIFGRRPIAGAWVRLWLCLLISYEGVVAQLSRFDNAYGRLLHSQSQQDYRSQQQQRLLYSAQVQRQQEQQQMLWTARKEPLTPLAGKLPLVPSAALFPGAHSTAALTQSQNVLTPEITQQRLAGSLFKNYGNERVPRVTNDDNKFYYNNNDNYYYIKNNDDWSHKNNNNNGNKNKNGSNSKNDNNSDNSADASGEWVFEPNTRRISGSAEESESTAPASAVSHRALCMSPGCRTWITISIPNRPNGSKNTVEGAIETTETRRTESVAKNSSTVTKSRPTSQPPSMSTTIAPSTVTRFRFTVATPAPVSRGNKSATRRPPAKLIFSTSWILSLKRVTIPSSTPSVSTTTVLTEAAVRPFTVKPKASPSGSVMSTTSELQVESGGEAPKKKSAKPWTHSGAPAGSTSRKKSGSKHRPSALVALPPPPDESAGGASNVEETAIWASAELIDAIREALERFRAALYCSGADERVQHDNGEPRDTQARDVLANRVQRILEEFQNGSWLERTLADAMLRDASLLEHPTADAVLIDAILPSLATKLADDPDHDLSTLLTPSSRSEHRQRRQANFPGSLKNHGKVEVVDHITSLKSSSSQEGSSVRHRRNSHSMGTPIKTPTQAAGTNRKSDSKSKTGSADRRAFRRIRPPKKMAPGQRRKSTKILLAN